MSCAICGGSAFAPVTTTHRSTFSSDGHALVRHHVAFPIGRCETCHHVQVTDPDPLQALRGVYEDHIYTGRHITTQAPERRRGDATAISHDPRSTPEYLRDAIELAMPQLLMSDDAIVDLGCGVGHILRELRGSFGIPAHRLIGIDFIPQLDPQHGIDSVVADLNALDERSELACLPERVGFVFSTHLLEHMLAPRALLRFAHRILAPGGHMLLEVPDHGYFQPENLPGNERYITFVIPEHLHYFGMASLNRLVSSSGFEIVRAEARHTSDGFLPRLVMVLRKAPLDGTDRIVAYTCARTEGQWPAIGDRAAALIEAGPCAIWGCGFGLLQMLAYSPRFASAIGRAAIYDSNHAGKLLDGQPVRSEDALEGFKGSVILTPAQPASRYLMTERGRRLGLRIADPFTSS